MDIKRINVKYIYRDVKPENILINLDEPTKPTIQFKDLCLANHFKANSAEYLGTPICFPPEVITTKKYSAKHDVWSAGIVVHLLLFGSLPFKEESNRHLFKLIEKDDIQMDIRLANKIKNEAIDFLKFVLEKNPDDRPSASQVLEHPWLQEDPEDAEQDPTGLNPKIEQRNNN